MEGVNKELLKFLILATTCDPENAEAQRSGNECSDGFLLAQSLKRKPTELGNFGIFSFFQ